MATAAGQARVSEVERGASGRFARQHLFDVDLHLYSQPLEWESLRRARRLAARVAGLSDRVHLVVHDFESDRAGARRTGIDRVPTFCVGGGASARARYVGVPDGRLYPNLLDELLEVSRGEHRLEAMSLRLLGDLDRPTELRVYAGTDDLSSALVSRLAHRCAWASPWLTAETVIVREFPELADADRVRALPTVTVNTSSVRFEGALPEASFVRQVLRAREAAPERERRRRQSGGWWQSRPRPASTASS
jgi:hypothetical protein